MFCGWIFASRSTGPAQLQDSDTVALLDAVRARNDPLSWFAGDWPLENHFYRPLPTLTFEIDNALHANDGSGYGITSALIAIACVLLLFWLLRELTDSPVFTGLSTLLFAVWHVNPGFCEPAKPLFLMLAGLCLLGVLRGGRKKLGVCVIAALTCLFLGSQLSPIEHFSARIVHWLPGRTASVMAFFALVALASYARYVRVTSVVRPADPASTDVPATKSHRQSFPSGKANLWLIAAFVGLLCAFASYEQSVTLPALLTGVWLLFSLNGKKSAWWPLTVFWLLLVAFFVFRMNILPPEASGYQQQQFRTGPGVWISLGDYLIPGLFATYLSMQGATLTTILLVDGTPVAKALTLLGNLVSMVKAYTDREQRLYFFAFLLFAFGAFMPMAWLKPFGHYHYFASAFRAAYAVTLSIVVLRLVASAVSLPEIRAPRRPDPAPGSLLRP